MRRASTRPAIAVLALLDAAIVNVIVGNADAHGKNFSLLYEGSNVTLALLYDLLCTITYPDLSPLLAMKVARRGTLEEIGTSTWPAFAADVGLSAPFVRRRVTELTDSAQSAVLRVAGETAHEGLDADALTKYASLIRSRAARPAKTV